MIRKSGYWIKIDGNFVDRMKNIEMGRRRGELKEEERKRDD